MQINHNLNIPVKKFSDNRCYILKVNHLVGWSNFRYRMETVFSSAILYINYYLQHSKFETQYESPGSVAAFDFCVIGSSRLDLQ